MKFLLIVGLLILVAIVGFIIFLYQVGKHEVNSARCGCRRR